MRLADFVVQFFEKKGYTVAFGVTGGGAMYLNDAFAKSEKIRFIPMHNEQSASMAGEGSCAVDQLGLVSLTTGPGGTNAISGCAGAWIDSQPLFFISGQVESFSLAGEGVRQFGIQEVSITKIIAPITKYSVLLTNPSEVRYHLEKAFELAFTGRKGPVWIDIPLDVQNAEIEPDLLKGYKTEVPDHRLKRMMDRKIKKIGMHLRSAERPVILIGNGCRGIDNLKEILRKFSLPVVVGWNGRDLVSNDFHLYFGSCGLFGNRSANFIVQNADFILGIGYRFSVPQVGYDPSNFAREAVIAAVDVDSNEFRKNGDLIDIAVCADSGVFLDEMMTELEDFSAPEKWEPWLDYCRDLTSRYPLSEVYNHDEANEINDPSIINPYVLMEKISASAKHDTFFITDMGTSFTCTHQTLALKHGQRLFTSSGLAAMGFGLAGTIGVAARTDRPIVLIVGDGGFMFNLQELVILSSISKDVKIFLLDNAGYLTMRHMQKNRFNRLVGEGPETDLPFIDFNNYAALCGFSAVDLSRDALGRGELRNLLESDKPTLIRVSMDINQPLVPRVQTISNDSGQLFPTPIEDMYPHLKTATFSEHMIIQPMPRPEV